MKKILILSISVFLFGIQKVPAQNYLDYYQTINKAEIAYIDKDYQKSDSLYLLAFEKVDKPFKEDFYLAALNADKLNNNLKVYNYLQKGVENGLELKRVKTLKSFTNSEFYKILKQDYKRLRNTYLQTLNISLRNEIAKMIKKDQAVRHSIFGGSKHSQKTDAYNYNRLLEIIKDNDNKWPGFSTIGETCYAKYDVTNNIAIMLLHFSREQIENLKPFMIRAVLNGEMYPYHLARAIDYKHLMFKECQLYGTYNYNPKINSTEICDREKAELERAKIGLEPIKEYYRKRNWNYKCIEK